MPFSIYTKHIRGFTIVESLVAISIILVAIAGPLTLANNSLSSAVSSKEQLAAAYLAQDALEYIRWARDTSTFLVVSNILSSPCASLLGCSIDTTATTLLPVTCLVSQTPCPLNYNTTLNQYTHNLSTVGTPYSRSVQVSVISPIELSIAVTVMWKTPAGVRQIVVKENLLDWK